MKTRSRILIAALALVAPAGASCAASEAGDDLVLARVNGEAITLQDLRDAFEEHHTGHASVLAGEAIIRQALDGAVEEKLLIEEGRRRGLHQQPAFEAAIELTRDTLLVGVLEKRYKDRLAEPDEEEIDRAYDLLSRQVHVELIEARSADGARSARLRVTGGERFEDVAGQMSTHGSRDQGGDLGWVTWGVLDPVTESVAFETSVGSMSEPFVVNGGRYRIVRVSEERAGHPPAREMVLDRIRAVIVSRDQHALKEALLAEIMRDHPPTIDEAAIEKLVSGPDRGHGPASGPADPDDGTILLTTAIGLPISAGYVRERARKSGLSLLAAWDTSRDDALLIDEARRRIPLDEEIRKKVEIFVERRLLAEVESATLSGLRMSEEAVRSAFDADPEAFATPASIRIRHIVLSTREEAEEVHRLLENGGDFGRLVSERSVDLKTRDNGGDLGWMDVVAADPMDDDRRAIFALEPGQFTGVMKIKLGYSIVQALGRRPPLIPPYEQVREAAARLHYSRQASSARNALIARLRGEASIETLEPNISRAIAIQDGRTSAP